MCCIPILLNHTNLTSSIDFVITDVLVGPSLTEMNQETAFRIFPIVHQYGMLILECCEKAFERNQLSDLWPSDPIASSDVFNHPGLIQCLALADAKQCDSLVQSCLSQLIMPGSVTQNIHGALASPHLEKLMDGLRSETNRMIIRKLAGLPENHKVRCLFKADISEAIEYSRVGLSDCIGQNKCAHLQCRT